MPHEPKKRHSTARQGKRRAHLKLATHKGVSCLNCGTINMPHTICRTCGFYKGQEVIAKKAAPQEA